MKKTLKVNCPTCETELVYDTNNPYRPFCSKRCRLIDLGEWASEGYKVPSSGKDFDPTVEGNDSDDSLH